MNTRAPSAGAPTLPLWPSEEDVEFPFTDVATVAEHGTPAQIIDSLADEVTALRRALVDTLAHVEAGTPAPGSRIRAWRELAGTAYDDNLTPTERRDEGIARAAAKWTAEESARVDEAIAHVAAQARHDARTRKVGDGLEEFTTADVWRELGEGFPITKGIAGRMLAAKGAGIIANTGRTVIAPRDATGPNHGQRLTVWRAL